MVVIIPSPTKIELWNCGYQFTVIPHNLTSSCWSLSLTSLRLIFPSAEWAAKENSREDRPGVSWAGAQGLIMESVSHKQNSVNSDSGSNASKEFGENWEISCFCLLYFLVIHLSDQISCSFCPGLEILCEVCGKTKEWNQHWILLDLTTDNRSTTLWMKENHVRFPSPKINKRWYTDHQKAKKGPITKNTHLRFPSCCHFVLK